VWAVARKYCGRGADAEDAAQEAFVRLWRVAGSYDPARGSEQVFVTMVARSAVLDWTRRASRRVGAGAGAGEGARGAETQLEARPAQGADAGLALADDARRALEAMRALPDDQREAVRLTVQRGLTHEQAAAHLAVPLGTLKTRVRTALLRLRGAMTTPGGATTHAGAGEQRKEGAP
jgi:RNA polymerase sigma-70 factor (ECF subfamily)